MHRTYAQNTKKKIEVWSYIYIIYISCPCQEGAPVYFKLFSMSNTLWVTIASGITLENATLADDSLGHTDRSEAQKQDAAA